MLALKMITLVGRCFNKYWRFTVPVYLAIISIVFVYTQITGLRLFAESWYEFIAVIPALFVMGWIEYLFISREANCSHCGAKSPIGLLKKGICLKCRGYPGLSIVHKGSEGTVTNHLPAVTPGYVGVFLGSIALSVGMWFIDTRFSENMKLNRDYSKHIERPKKASSSNNNSIAEGFESPTNNDELTNSYVGKWNGNFGPKQIELDIETIDADGRVTGYNVVGNNRRSLLGSLENGLFVLREPGDDKWDGIFTFRIEGGACAGEWASNNGKLRRKFTLERGM